MAIRKESIFGLLFILAIGWMAVMLNGCTVGPDFVPPSQPEVHDYTTTEIPPVIAPATGEADQRIHIGEEISSQWWELFNDPALNDVMRTAIEKNPTIAAAKSTLASARETVIATKGGYYPQVDFPASFDRRKASALTSENSFSGSQGGSLTSNLYSLGPTVSYSLDVFGGTRRKVEQQQALAEFQGYELAAAYLTLTGNVVTQAITVASLRSQIQATEDVIAEDDQNLSLVRRKFEAGKATRTDVLTVETQLDSDRTLLAAGL